MNILRKVSIFLFAMAASLPLSAFADDPMAHEHIGVGVVLGYPTAGVSAKLPMDPTHSLNIMLGYDLPRNGLYSRFDYVWVNNGLFSLAQGRLPVYYGPGIHVSAHDGLGFGIHAVIGIEYQLSENPLDIFFEAAPGINVIPNTEPSGSLGLGVRFFF